MVRPVGQKNGRNHLKLAPCCFWSIISPHTKSHPKQTKNTEIFSVGRFWLVGLVGQKMVVGISNSLCCFCTIISLHIKFHRNRMKNTEVKNFHFWSILVGRAGRSKNGRNHFKHSESDKRLTNDVCTKFEPNRSKNG